jgi:hypothetical protein
MYVHACTEEKMRRDRKNVPSTATLTLDSTSLRIGYSLFECRVVVFCVCVSMGIVLRSRNRVIFLMSSSFIFDKIQLTLQMGCRIIVVVITCILWYQLTKCINSLQSGFFHLIQFLIPGIITTTRLDFDLCDEVAVLPKRMWRTWTTWPSGLGQIYQTHDLGPTVYYPSHHPCH